MSTDQWLTLILLTIHWWNGFCDDFNFGCDCGLREIDEQKEKECEESALLDSSDNVNHLKLNSVMFYPILIL